MAAEIAMVLKFKVDKQPFVLPLTVSVGFGLTPREAGRVKQLADGVCGSDILDAITKGDVQVLAALAIVAMERSGTGVNAEAVMSGAAELEVDADGPTVDPPVAVDAAAAQSTTPSTSMIPAGTGTPS